MSVMYRNNRSVCVCIWVYVCVSLSVCVSVSLCVCEFLCVCMWVYVCVSVSLCGFECVCVWPKHYIWHHISQCLTTGSTSDTVAGRMFRHVETARPTPILFAYSYSISSSFIPSCTILLHPSTPHRPLHNDLATVYLQLPFILTIIHYSDNWT